MGDGTDYYWIGNRCRLLDFLGDLQQDGQMGLTSIGHATTLALETGPAAQTTESDGWTVKQNLFRKNIDELLGRCLRRCGGATALFLLKLVLKPWNRARPGYVCERCYHHDCPQ